MDATTTPTAFSDSLRAKLANPDQSWADTIFDGIRNRGANEDAPRDPGCFSGAPVASRYDKIDLRGCGDPLAAFMERDAPWDDLRDVEDEITGKQRLQLRALAELELQRLERFISAINGYIIEDDDD